MYTRAPVHRPPGPRGMGERHDSENKVPNKNSIIILKVRKIQFYEISLYCNKRLENIISPKNSIIIIIIFYQKSGKYNFEFPVNIDPYDQS